MRLPVKLPAHSCRASTTPKRLAKGLLSAAAVGAFLVSLPFGPAIIIAFPVAFTIWGFGLVVIGLPAWLVLNRLGAKCLVSALVLGGGLNASIAALTLLAASHWGAAPDAMALVFAAAFSLLGVTVGGVGWTTAYESAPTTSLEAVFG